MTTAKPTPKDAPAVPAVDIPLDRTVRPARAWLVRRADWPADMTAAVVGETPPAWASIARPLYFVDDIDECVVAERERCVYWCGLGSSDGYADHHISVGTPVPAGPN